MKRSRSGGVEVFIRAALRYLRVWRCGEGAGDVRNILSALMCAVDGSVFPRGRLQHAGFFCINSYWSWQNTTGGMGGASFFMHTPSRRSHSVGFAKSIIVFQTPPGFDPAAKNTKMSRR